MRETVILVGLLVLALGSMRTFVGYWKGVGLDALRHRYRRFWPYGDAALEGWLRAQMVLYIGLWILVAAFAVAVLLPAADPSSRPTARVLTIIGFLCFGGNLVTAASIVLLNFPSRFALPHLRHQEGMLFTWLRSRQNRNHGDAD